MVDILLERERHSGARAANQQPKVKHGLSLSLSLILVGPADAADLDLSTTSSSGCDPQWTTECLSNDVWGPDDSLGVAQCGDDNALYMHGVSGQVTAVGFPKESLNGSSLDCHATGDAESSDVVVKWQLKFFNSSDVLVGSDEAVIHSGAAGPFSDSVEVTGYPSSAVAFSSRLVTHTPSAQAANSILFFGGCSERVGCTKLCPDGYGGFITVAGQFEGQICNVDCPDFGECDPDEMPVEE